MVKHEEKMSAAWEALARDMKVAVDEVYAPLDVICEAYEEFKCIHYHPPFYLADKCNEISFGVQLDEESEPKYPLECTSEIYTDTFVVKSKEDWKNHVEKFVVWKKEIEELIQKIRS